MISRFPRAGTEHNLRCALENLDGVIGPWSEELLAIVPANLNRIREACDDKGSYAADEDGNSSTRCHSHHRCRQNRSQRAPGKRTCKRSVPNLGAMLPARFDLAVPTLIEAFAAVADASFASRTFGAATQAPAQPRSPPLHPTCRIVPLKTA